MRIKKYTGPSIKDATRRMKEELGPEAIIISSRRVSKSGLLGFLEKEMYEVTAAVDGDPVPETGVRSRGRAAQSFADSLIDAHQVSLRTNPGIRSGDDTLDSLRMLSEHFEKSGRTPSAQESAKHHGEERGGRQPRQTGTGRWDLGDLVNLQGDVDDIKSSLREITEHLKYDRMPSLPKSFKEAFGAMMNNGVEQEIAAEIVQIAYGRLGESQGLNRRMVDDEIVRQLQEFIRVAGPVENRRKRTRIVALVGPTGVGKTTTIAKLAAIGKLVEHKNVALLSADTYRIGAIEQLRTFAAIADIPMEVIYKPSEVGPALRRFRGKDTIYIDTVGRSQRGKKDLADLLKFLTAAQPDEVHLVLSASTNAITMTDVIERFGMLKPNRLIFSKLDEAAALGSLVSVLRRQTLPISYVTVGQGVPDDIIAAEPQKIASMVYSGVIVNA
jgi:flagellar biosynthesis protein FlhF